jgi:hypothetical protein
MPNEPLTLPVVIQTTWDAYIENKLPDMPGDGPAIDGVTDAQLWEDIRTSAGDDPADALHGMTFQEATCADPRRVDALVQQRVSGVLYWIHDDVSGGQDWTGHEEDLKSVTHNEAYLDRYHYLVRLDLCRANHDGEVTATGLAETFEISWDAGSKILAASLLMAFPKTHARPNQTALLMWRAFEARIIQLRRAMREAREILARAADAAPDQESSDAWRRMDATVMNMDQTISENLRSAGVQVPEQFGGMTVAAQRMRMLQAGHRAPQMPLGQWRQAGGRVF